MAYYCMYCGDELIPGKNWDKCNIKMNIHICRGCRYAYHRAWYRYIGRPRKLAKHPAQRKFTPHNIKKFKAIAPDGRVFIVSNMTEFAKEHGLKQPHISNCLHGSNQRKSHHGWRFEPYELRDVRDAGMIPIPIRILEKGGNLWK